MDWEDKVIIESAIEDGIRDSRGERREFGLVGKIILAIVGMISLLMVGMFFFVAVKQFIRYIK
jgi:hypothetical protein